MLAKALLAEFEHEVNNTRRLLQSIPAKDISFKPSPISWTMGELSQHIATIYHWYAGTLTQEVYDIATDKLQRGDPANIEATLQLFEDNVAKARAALQESTDESLQQVWTLKVGARTVIGPVPRAVAARGFLFNHIYHHRGELIVYLRATGNKVPGLYGPAYEDNPARKTAQ